MTTAPSARGRRALLALAVLLFVLVAMLVVVASQGPAWLSAMMTPDVEFDAAQVPPAPDYGSDAAWLALPSLNDEADVALPELPAAKDPAVDVFYLHPTSSIAPAWNAPWDDPTVRTASIRGGTLIQASAFNGCCAIYAPTYRQASGIAFTARSSSGERAIALAASDVVSAFAEFQRRRGGARPFLIVGHSQGAALGARLLREHILQGPARQQLVAAYLIGAPLTPDDVGGLPGCASRDATGCVVSYNARGPGHADNRFEIGSRAPRKEHLCVNPVLGAVGEQEASREQHGGAVFFDAERPALLPAFTAGACRDGRLVVPTSPELPWRGLPSAILLWAIGGKNFHPVEVQLYYADLRADAARRARAFLAGAAPSPG